MKTPVIAVRPMPPGIITLLFLLLSGCAGQGPPTTATRVVHPSFASLVFPRNARGHTSKTLHLYADGDDWTLLFRYTDCVKTRRGAVALNVYESPRHSRSSLVVNHELHEASGVVAYRIHDRGDFYAKVAIPADGGCAGWEIGMSSF
jgi:hypothetical protein